MYYVEVLEAIRTKGEKNRALYFHESKVIGTIEDFANDKTCRKIYNEYPQVYHYAGHRF